MKVKKKIRINLSQVKLQNFEKERQDEQDKAKEQNIPMAKETTNKKPKVRRGIAKSKKLGTAESLMKNYESA